MRMIGEPAHPGVGGGAHPVGSFLRARARANSDPRSRTFAYLAPDRIGIPTRFPAGFGVGRQTIPAVAGQP